MKYQMLAGFPCQPFSFAGNRLGFEDTRGTLFFWNSEDFKRKKAIWIFIRKCWRFIKSWQRKNNVINTFFLKNLGYKVTYNLINAEEHGLAQSRKRVYIVGTLIKEISLENFEKKTCNF